MRFALIADVYLPLRTSGAVQIRDLSREFSYLGHEITVIVPTSEIQNSWFLEDVSGVKVLWLRAPNTKKNNYIMRTFAEFLMPYFMIKNLQKSPLANHQWDGVIWYSPSIFHGPFANSIKRRSNCKSYLIIRDIFPQWAADMQIINKIGLIYFIFNIVARYQYAVADTIGVQTQGNLNYFKDWVGDGNRRLEVLQNWLFDTPIGYCSIKLSKTKLAGRRIFLYVGNMGIAQGVGTFVELADLFQKRTDVGFLFVGRGSEAKRLFEYAKIRKINNILFYDEIHPDEIPSLCSQCAVGLIALDPKHKTHNIPGKFLTYMQAGLPVLGIVNENNDLIRVIKKYRIGFVCINRDLYSLKVLASKILDLLYVDNNVKSRCRDLYLKHFSPGIAVKQIVNALK